MTCTRVVAGILVGLGLLGEPSAAQAETVAQRGGIGINVYEGTWADNGHVNDITVTRADPNFLLSDPAGITARNGSNCTQVSPTLVSCPAEGARVISAPMLLGGNDRLVLPAQAGLEWSEAFLGSGDDFMRGGDERTKADGMSGNDLIYLGGGDDHSVTGGPGNDTIHGEAGFDSISGDYNSHAGEPYSFDDIVQPGDDLLDGGDGHDILAGDQGSDTLIGGPEGDLLQDCESWSGCGRDEPVPVFDKLSGGDGNDIFDAGLGEDIIDGGPGNDTINAVGGTASGGEGNDIMRATGSTYGAAAVLSGGAGDDLLTGLTPAFFGSAASQISDVLSCGAGTADQVAPGPGDIVDVDCEFVNETTDCGAASCEATIAVVALQPPTSRADEGGGSRKLVLAAKSFELHHGPQSIKVKLSSRAVRKLLKRRPEAAVTKKFKLTERRGGAPAERTKTRYKLKK